MIVNGRKTMVQNLPLAIVSAALKLLVLAGLTQAALRTNTNYKNDQQGGNEAIARLLEENGIGAKPFHQVRKIESHCGGFPKR